VIQLDTIFAELGRRLGLGVLNFEAPGPLKLDIASLGAISFETASDGRELLVTLSWPLAPHDRNTLIKAFEASTLEKSENFPFQPGLLGDRLLLMTRKETDHLDAPTLETLILRLIKLSETLKTA
jgi:type III secretion system chaperone SycN